MGTDIGKFVLLIAGSQENSCLMSSIYSKKKTRSSAGRSNRDRFELYQEEKMCKRREEQKRTQKY